MIARGAALFGWRRLIEPKLTMLAVEQEAMAEYVRALEAGETVNAETQGEVSRAMAPWHVDLTLGRVMAAALEMRQGAAVPAAAEIGEESWLWDPLMQRPYSMARSEENDGRVTVYIYRDYGEQREVQGRVSVAAGQAGLEGLEVIGPDDPMATSRIY